MDLNSLQVPVTKQVREEDPETGKVTYKDVTEMEAFNPSGKQSDGSQYFVPKKLVSDDHEHFFEKKKPEDRHVVCECGFGGEVYPHNTVLKNGHVYNLKGKRIA